MPCFVLPCISSSQYYFPQHIVIYFIGLCYLISSPPITKIYDIINSSKKYPQGNDDQDRIISNYLNNPNKKIVTFAADYNVHANDPFGISSTHAFRNRILFSGWFAGIPLNYSLSNGYDGLLGGPGLFLGKGNINALSEIIRSLSDNYNCFAESKIVMESNNYVIAEFFEKPQIHVESWGPHETIQGTRFNPQPGEFSAIWVKVEGVARHPQTYVSFGGNKIKEIAVTEGGVTFAVKDDLISRPGKYDVSIIEGDTGRKIKLGDFLVRAKN
jgi:hypothetical protein